MLAKVAVVSAFVGAASVASLQAAQADTGDPLAGSDTAIVVGGTFESTPSTAFAQTAEDLYLHPLGFDDGATYSTVCDMVGTDPCSAPLQVLTTPELLQQGPSSLTGADDLTLAVENEFNANPGAFSAEHPLTIFGYSQGGTVESIAMTQLAEAGIPSADLQFVSIADVSLPGGIWANIVPDLVSLLGPSLTNDVLNFFDLDSVVGNVTPDNLYPATIYTVDGDAFADFQQDWASGGPLAVLAGISQHADYLGLTPDQIADATTTTDGDLTLVDISSNDINGLDALIGAIDNGLANSGLLESLSETFQLFLTNTF
jgi:PE-PPE domain